MVDFCTIDSFLNEFVLSGIPMEAFWQARANGFKNAGMTSSLSLETWYKAAKGYVSRLRHSKHAFICPSCKETPPFLVFDGKQTGPQKRKVDHLRELSAPENDEILPRASEFRDRVFLQRNEDRNLILQLFANEITADEFLATGLQSEISGNLVVTLVTRLIVTEVNEELPKVYKTLLASCCKRSPVCGFLQVSSSRPLEILKGFCVEAVNVRDVENIQYLKILRDEIPPLWKMLTDILDYENSVFLPLDVAEIVEHLIQIREETFIKSIKRKDEEYVLWDDPTKEHCTMFYPAFPMIRYPKRYSVAGEVDPERCCKSLGKHRDFSHGLFSVGCACKYSTTYGFELLLNPEDPHNVFRFFMCRKVKLSGQGAVKAGFYDNACN